MLEFLSSTESTRRIIFEKLKVWEGGPAPLSRKWVEDEIEGVDFNDRNKARVALLVAKASYQIDDQLLSDLLKDGLCEAELLTLGAWSAFQGAKTVANWAWESARSSTKEEV